MLFKIMKKDSFKIPFKSNFFKEQDPFHLVIIFFIIFFGTAIFFSIPSFYDYKKYNQQIEKTINNEFKFKIHNLKDISFRFIPSPHLLIKKSDFKINDNESDLISELKNIKVFISITDLYKKDQFKIKRIEISKANFYLNNISLKNLTQNLKKDIVNHLIIKKSKFFFKNDDDEIILISTIKNLDYKIDFTNDKKIFKVNGNIFDTNYEFKYLLDYKNPNIQKINLEFKNPNLIIENNLIEDPYSLASVQKGNLIIRFLNQKNSINYEILDNRINILKNDLKNFNFDLNGSIDFQPFHFDLLIDIKKMKLSDIENIFYIIYSNQNLKYENLSGILKLNFNNIENKVINKGLYRLVFENSKVYSDREIFYLKDFATLEISDYQYLENIDQILQMKVKVNIINQEKFNRFLFNYKKNKILSKNIYFTYQFNNNTNTNFISQISNKGFGNFNELYKFNNLQQLKFLLRDENLFMLD